MSCPFCSLPPERINAANTAGWMVRDAYPVSPGHTLIISRRQVGSFFELSEQERTGMLRLLDEAKSQLQGSHRPQGCLKDVVDRLPT
jgi:diadenosine tetraphosphate (Ap4A) HIT family hydrolase